jgi:hypothetical protein
VKAVARAVGQGPDFLQEAPSVATWRFKDRECLGPVSPDAMK